MLVDTLGSFARHAGDRIASRYHHTWLSVITDAAEGVYSARGGSPNDALPKVASRPRT